MNRKSIVAARIEQGIQLLMNEIDGQGIQSQSNFVDIARTIIDLIRGVLLMNVSIFLSNARTCQPLRGQILESR